MKILITGATGFLGKSLIQHLLDTRKNIEIVAVSRSVDKLQTSFDSRVKTEATDYSLTDLLRLTNQVDTVVHLASQLMQRDTDKLKISQFNDNLAMVENLMIASHQNKVSQFINTSSISVYHSGENLSEGEALSPSNIYGVSKAHIEDYLLYFQKHTEVNIVSLRLARLYGVGERKGLMFTDFIQKSIEKDPLTIYGEGASTIEYIYIKDAVDLFDKIIGVKNIKGSFNIGVGKSYSIKEIAESITKVFQNSIVYFKDKPDGIEGNVMNVSKIFEKIGWKSKWTLDDSIRDIKNILENEK